MRGERRRRRPAAGGVVLVLAMAAALTPVPAEAAPTPHPGCTMQTLVFTNTTAVPIVDSGTATSSISVSALTGYLWDVDLVTHITHTYNGHLTITLTSPEGTETVITSNNGGPRDDVFNGTTWDDDAGDTAPPGPVTDHAFVDGVVATPLVPEGSLAALSEGFASPNGTWTLKITDGAAGDVGMLHRWALHLTTIAGEGGLSGVGTTGGSTNTAVAISDNATVTSSIQVADEARPLQSVSLTLWIEHTWNNDLTITLTSPAGTVVTVSSNNGDWKDDVFNGSRFHDSGSNGPVTDYSFSDGVAADFLVPEESFGAFSGEDPNGTWVLSVTDGAAGDVGKIARWSMWISSTACDFVAKPGLYATTSTGVMFSVDLATGQGTKLYDMYLTPAEIACPFPEPQYVHDCFIPAPLPATSGRYMRFEEGWSTRSFATGAAFTGLEYVAGVLYGASIGAAGGPSTLQIVDPLAGAATPIGSTGVGPIAGLAYDPNTATMYAISGGPGPAVLYTINLTTGAATIAGTPNIHAGSLEFGPDGLLYAGGVGSDRGRMFRIDPSTGVSEDIGATWIGSGYGDPIVGLARITNSPPVAKGDQYTVPFAGRLDGVGLLANDFDMDADTLTAHQVTAPSHGTLTLRADGSFTYVHGGSATGADTFTYEANDGARASNQVSVTIQIQDEPPPPPPPSPPSPPPAPPPAPPSVPPTIADTVGLVDPTQGRWHLRDGAGQVTSFFFGNPGDVPVMGDWDGDGIDTPGLFRTSDAFAYLSNANRSQIADIRFFFGNPSDVPLAGDWDGDGDDTLSIYRPAEQRFYIINQLGQNEGGLGPADFSFGFGNPGDKPVAGDWDGDGVDEVGLHRESTGFFYWRNSLTTGVADGEIFFGDPNDRFVAGDWGTVDGADTPSVFRPADTAFFFRHTLTEGVADSQFGFGQSGWLPVAGAFGLG